MTAANQESDEQPHEKEPLSQDELLARGWATLPDDYRIPDVAPDLDEAQAWCKRLAESHYVSCPGCHVDELLAVHEYGLKVCSDLISLGVFECHGEKS